MTARFFRGLTVLAVALALVGMFFPVAPAEAPVARDGYTTGVYVEQGANKLVIASGGEIEVQSGGTVDIQGGATYSCSTSLASLAIGGGYGTTGATIGADGLFRTNGNVVIDGTVGITNTISAAGSLNMTKTNAASGSANPIDWTATAGIMNGSDDLTVVDINLTNANHTSTGNTLQAIDVGNITGDADATETAINIGTGWDSGLALGSPLDVGGGYGSTGCTTSIAGALSCDDAIIAGGGYASSGCTLSAAGVLQCAGAGTFDGAVYGLINASIVTTNTNVTAAQTGSRFVYQNQSTFAVTLTLPAAAAGLNYCFYVYDGDDVLIDTQTGDQVHHLTNATGDRISNSTAGDSVCLVAIDTTYWVPSSETGTWADAD